MSDTAFITASFDRQIEALQRGLSNLKTTAQGRVMKKSIRKGLMVMNKAIKSEVPPEWSRIKKLISYRLSRRAFGDASVSGKVGVGVGKKKERKAVDRTGRPGVGLSVENVHWFILGTQPRVTKTGHSTGAMPPQVPGIVQRGVAASYKSALREMAKTAEIEIAKECEKIRQKIRAAM